MIEPMTEEEIQGIAKDYNFSIEKVRASAKHLDQIEAILKKHDDFTRREALLSVYMRKYPAPII